MKKAWLCLAAALVLLVGGAAYANEGGEVTVLFTHDLHSHLLPGENNAGDTYGGYARMQTAIDAERQAHPDALLLDGGDFSMGTLFQTVFSSDAAELRIMGGMGYDAVTFGNHEYDYRSKGLADMLEAALASGEPLPDIVQANYLPPREGEQGYDADAEAAWAAFERYGVKDYAVFQSGGINVAVFGLLGQDAHESAPMSGMVLRSATETAAEVVAEIEDNVPEPRMIVCLSHSGVSSDSRKSEDERLAADVKGIDLIISGHTHTTLSEPIVVGDTYIAACGEYGKNLGSITLRRSGEGFELADYHLIPIDGSVEEDPVVLGRIEEYKRLVEQHYLGEFGGMQFDQVLAHNPHSLESLAELNIHREAALGNLIADSYKWMVETAEGGEGVPVDFALTANGVVRESLPTGDITVENAFNALSLGIGADGVPGYPLVSVYLTGRDIKNLLEVDASVTAIMSAAQLYYSGGRMSCNPNRMIFNKVTDSALIGGDGSERPIEDDELYRVVTGLFCGQMLETVNSKSFGILSITPRDAQGNEITDLEAYIVHDAQGREIKEWHALASYLEHLGTVPEQYAGPQGRKVIVDSLNPVELLRSPNHITLAVTAAAVLLIVLIAFAVRAAVKRGRKRREK